MIALAAAAAALPRDAAKSLVPKTNTDPSLFCLKWCEELFQKTGNADHCESEHSKEECGACTFCSPEAKEARDDAAKCAVCGEGNNCCGAHGSWDGACPNQHTFEEGHDACLKLGGEGEVKAAEVDTAEEGASDCMDWCSDVFTKTSNTAHCTAEDSKEQCGACAFCSSDAKTVKRDASDKCTVCGEGNNCCGQGGSWAGTCPAQHTFDDGHDACLAVMDPPGPEDPTGDDAAPRKQCKSAPKGKPDPKLSKWASAERLNDLFLKGEPSNSLTRVGLLVHNFDLTEDEEAPWRPCGDDGICPNERKWWNMCGPCPKVRSWWSTSVINWRQKSAFADGGIILAPEKVTVLCSYPFDMGTMERGCGIADNKFGPEGLEQMTHMSMYQDGLYNRKNMYNEVLIAAQNFTAELPYTIAAFVFNLNGQNAAQYGGEDEVTERYVKFLDRNCLTESDIPLLKANLSAVDATASPAARASARVFEDVSSRARQHLRANPPKPRKQEDESEELRAESHAFRVGVPGSVRDYSPTAEMQEELSRGGNLEQPRVR